MSELVRQLSWRDWGVPGVLWVAAQVELWGAGALTGLIHGPKPVFAVAYSVAAAALCFRRTMPTTTLVVVVAVLLVTGTPTMYIFLTSAIYMLVVAIFACGRYGQSRTRYLALVLPEIPVLAEVWVSPADYLADAWTWGFNAWWIFALGAGFRHERALRDRLAVATTAEAEVRAANQRLGLAREVHDVVSHGLSVVVVQAELAQMLLESDTAGAREALKSVQSTGRQALSETRRLLEELREPGLPDGLAPAPNWSDLPDLVGRMRHSGLPVVMETLPATPPLSPQVSAATYRIVQEALTNVMRHAGKSPTRVRISQDDSHLIIEVRDVGGPSQGQVGAGFGLAGMRERVAGCGGDLTAGPAVDGGYHVRAVLPLGERR